MAQVQKVFNQISLTWPWELGDRRLRGEREMKAPVYMYLTEVTFVEPVLCAANYSIWCLNKVYASQIDKTREWIARYIHGCMDL